MDFRTGFELSYHFPDPTPVISMLNIHYSRVSDLVKPDHLILEPSVELSGYRDTFGNWCTRFLAPAGQFKIYTDFIIRDSGLPDPDTSAAHQSAVERLPVEALVFLLPSRFWELLSGSLRKVGRDGARNQDHIVFFF